MALGDGVTWDETEPTEATEASLAPVYMTDDRVGVRKRMQQEHFWPAAQTGVNQAGQHTYLTLQAQTGFPGFINNNSGTSLQIAGIWVDVNSVLWYSSTATTSPTLMPFIMGTIGAFTSTATTGGAPGLGIVQNTSNGNILLSGALGTWQGKTTGVVYQAASDGFVIGYASGTGGVNMSAYSDSNNPPTTLRQYVLSPGSGNGAVSICMPVRKGDYWEVTYGGAVAPTILWLPLGA